MSTFNGQMFASMNPERKLEEGKLTVTAIMREYRGGEREVQNLRAENDTLDENVKDMILKEWKSKWYTKDG